MPVNITGGGLEFDATINGSQFQQQIRNIERDLNRLASTTEQRGAELEGIFKKAASAAAGFFSIQAAQGFIKQLVEVRGQFEQLEVAYSTILKSKSKGDALFQETIALAATTPFNLTEVAQSTKQLLAYGVAAKDVTGTLRMLGDIAAGVSAPIGDIAYLYGTLKTQGRAYMTDIRQFTGRGIPIIAELAKQFHITEGEVNKLVETGKVGFPEVEKAFKNLTSSGGIFFNLMEAQSKTLTGRLSNLQDAFAQMLNEIGKANSGLLNDGITGLSNLVNHYKDVIDIIELLIVAYGTYKAVTMAATAVQALQAAGAASLTAAELLHYGALTLLTRAQLAYNSAAVKSAIVTTAYTAVITGIIAAIKSWSDATDLNESIQNSFLSIAKSSNQQVDAQRTKIADLTKIVLDHNTSQKDRISAIKKINEISPDYLGNLKEESFRTGEASKAIDTYLKALDKKLIGEAAYSAKLENQKKINDLKSRGADALTATERAGLSMKGIFKNGLTFSTETDNKTIINDLIKSYETANAKIDEQFKEQIKANLVGESNPVTDVKITKNAAYFQMIIDDNTEILKALDKSAKNFKAQSAKYKKIISDAQNELDSYDLKADKKNNDAFENELERRGELIRKIYDLNQKYNGDSLWEDEQKLQSIRDEYKKVSDEIDKFNGKSKNGKLSKGVLQQNSITALNTQTDLNTNEAIKNDLNEKKALYAEYEAYKEKLGKDAADKEYKLLLQSGENYDDYLEHQHDKIPNGPLTAALQARKNIVDKATAEARRSQTEQYTELLAATLTYEQQRNLIIEKYLKQAADLRAKGYEDQAAQAIKNGEEELTSLDEAQVKKLEAYKELFDGITVLSSKRAKQDIDIIRKYINSAPLTKDVKDRFTKLLDDADKKIKDGLPNGLRLIANEFNNLSTAAGGFNEELGRALGVLGNILNSVADIKSQYNTFKDGDTDTFGKISSGLGILGAGISIISTIGGLFSNAQEKAEQAAYSQDLQIKAIDSFNKALERQLALTKEIYGPERLKAYAKDLNDIVDLQKNLNNQISSRISLTGNKEIDQELALFNSGSLDFNNLLLTGGLIKKLRESNGLAGKELDELTDLMNAGKLDEATSKMVQSLIDLKDQAVDTLNALKSETTGTAFGEIADSIVGLFQNGTTAAEDFGKNFEQIMQKSILNSFKRNALEKQLQGFYDNFFDFSKSDDVLTQDEIAKLKAQYDAVIAGAKQQFDALGKATGISFTGDNTANSSSLSGAIKGITEEQANVLSGTFRGVQLNTYNSVMELRRQSQENLAFQQEAMRAAIRNIELLESIDRNTKRSADTEDNYLPFLKDIAKNTSDSTNAILRGFGI